MYFKGLLPCIVYNIIGSIICTCIKLHSLKRAGEEGYQYLKYFIYLWVVSITAMNLLLSVCLLLIVSIHCLPRDTRIHNYLLTNYIVNCPPI